MSWRAAASKENENTEKRGELLGLFLSSFYKVILILTYKSLMCIFADGLFMIYDSELDLISLNICLVFLEK